MVANLYRYLGATEQALWLRDRAAPLHFVLTAQVTGAIQFESLRNALDRLQQSHPLLRVQIALDRHQTPYFAPAFVSIPMRVLPRQDAYQWQTEAMQELSQPFDWTEAPLMRVVLLQGIQVSELLLVCQHTIADGLSAVNLLQELLLLLSDSEISLPERLLPATLESLLSEHMPVHRMQVWLARGVLQVQRMQRWLKRRGKRVIFETGNLRIKSGQLSSEVTCTLRDRCRQEGTTVHAAICTGLLFAVACHRSSQLTDEDNKNGVNVSPALQCFCPVNLRPYLTPPPEQDCGLYISPVRTTHQVSSDCFFWQVARSLKSDLMAQVEPSHFGKLAQQHAVLMAAKPTPEMVQTIFLDHCNSDVMVTNLGALAIPQQYGNLRLEAVYGPMVLSAFAKERVLGVTTLGDALFFTFIHQCSDTDDSGKMLAELAMQLLQQTIAAPDFTLATALQCWKGSHFPFHSFTPSLP
jgi:NRPS condensation-like uncharacterized protein